MGSGTSDEAPLTGHVLLPFESGNGQENKLLVQTPIHSRFLPTSPAIPMMARWPTCPPEVHAHILRSLSIGDISRLKQVDRLTKAVVNGYIQHKFSAERCLSRWFSRDQTTAFRKFQAVTGITIGGSAVLALLRSYDFEPEDLDCFVPIVHFEACVKLIEGFGYRYWGRTGSAKDSKSAFRECCSSNVGPGGTPVGVVGAFKFFKADEVVGGPSGESSSRLKANEDFPLPPLHPDHGDIEDIGDMDLVDSQLNPHRSSTATPEPAELKTPAGRWIHLMPTGGSPMLPIVHSHSTMVMNVLTYNDIWSLYPQHTLEDKCFLPLDSTDQEAVSRLDSGSIQEAFDKYKRRGFRALPTVSWKAAFDGRNELNAAIRFFGDKHCLRLPLDGVDDGGKKWEPLFPILNMAEDLGSLSWRLEFMSRHWFRVSTSAFTTADGVEYFVAPDTKDHMVGEGVYSIDKIPVPIHSQDVNRMLAGFYRVEPNLQDMGEYIWQQFEDFANSDEVSAHQAGGLRLHSAHAMIELYRILRDSLQVDPGFSWPEFLWRLYLFDNRTWLNLTLVAKEEESYQFIRDQLLLTSSIKTLNKLRITLTITGAGLISQVGLALVNELAAKIPDVFVYAGVRDIAKAATLQELVAKYPGKIEIVKYVSADVPGNKAIASTIQSKHGHVDVVVPCAGISDYLGPTVETPPEAMREHYEVNVVGTLVLFQAMYDLLKASEKPKFIPLTTVGASLTAFIHVPLGVTCYGASKAGLNYLARRIHFENEWLVCFPLSPGIVKTDMAISNREMDKTGSLAQLQDQMQVLPAEAATLLVKIMEESTREKEGGEFMNIDGTKVAW